MINIINIKHYYNRRNINEKWKEMKEKNDRTINVIQWLSNSAGALSYTTKQA